MIDEVVRRLDALLVGERECTIARACDLLDCTIVVTCDAFDRLGWYPMRVAGGHFPGYRRPRW